MQGPPTQRSPVAALGLQTPGSTSQLLPSPFTSITWDTCIATPAEGCHPAAGPESKNFSCFISAHRGGLEQAVLEKRTLGANAECRREGLRGRAAPVHFAPSRSGPSDAEGRSERRPVGKGADSVL